jgi:hypothetical protein
MQLHSPVIIQDVKAEMVNTLLTLISMMGQGMYGSLFSLQSWVILLFLMDATMQPGHCGVDLTINR